MIEFAVSVLLCAALVAVLRASPYQKTFLDGPDKGHAMHDRPVPRIGGVAIIVAATFVVTLVPMIRSGPCVAQTWLYPAGIVFAVSVLDDAGGIPIVWRLLAQLGAGTLFAVETLGMPGSLSAWDMLWGVQLVAMVLLLTWSANLYNFMDGANGLAGLMGFFGFGTYAMVEAVTGSGPSPGICGFCWALCGACAGFLFHNLPRGAVFMGDAGSVTLGFLAAAIGMLGIVTAQWPVWFPLLVFSPFWIDASYTLAKRALNRERIWEGHRSHIYQRLILLQGWSHVETSALYGLLMLLSGGTALWLVMTKQNPLYWLGAWVITYAVLLLIAEWRFTLRLQKTKIRLAQENQEAR